MKSDIYLGDKGPDCPLSRAPFDVLLPLFFADPSLSPRIVPLCFVRQLWSNVRFGGNLNSKTLKCHISLMICCKCTIHCKWLALLRERASIRYGCWRGCYKSSCKFLPRWFRYGLSWSFLRSTSQYYTYQFFSEWNEWDFHLVITEISGNVPATSEDLRRLPNDFRTLLKTKCPQMFQRRLSRLQNSLYFFVFKYVRTVLWNSSASHAWDSNAILSLR